MRQVRLLASVRQPDQAPTGNSLGWFRTLAFLAANLFIACNAPEINYGDCVAACNVDGDCLSGKVCKSGYCVEKTFTGVCGGGLGGSSATSSSAATGGTAGATGGSLSGATGGNRQAAGGSGFTTMGGESSKATGGSDTVLGGATSVRTTFWATGGNTDGGNSNVINVIGGAGPTGGSGSTSAINSNSANVGGSTNLLSNSAGGVPSVGGTSSLFNTDPSGDGDAGPGDAGPNCDESNTPQIVTQTLPQACVGQVFSAELQASHGGNYLWSATLPSGLNLTLAHDGTLSGVLTTKGEYSFDASVTDETTGCISAKQRITLSVGDSSVFACPTIIIQGKSPTSLAPESCVAWPYAANFAVSGGTGPYTWQALAVPPGVTFDSTSQEASGTPTDSGNLVLQVTDNGNGRIVQRTFSVPLRQKCWFAYVSSETGADRLQLVDPMLGTRLQRPTSNTTDSAVTDFKFSPNGKFIAYRVKDSTNKYSLWLWQAPGWDHEQQINLGGSVTHYAWSNNSQVIAVSIDTGTDTQLGGINVAGVPNTESVPGIQGILQLTPVAAPVQSDITWYGNDAYVAFHSPYSPGVTFDLITHAKYAQAGFQNVSTPYVDTYSESMVLYPNDSGFFVLDPTVPTIDFVPITSLRIFHANVAPAPNSAYVALASDGILNLYSAAEDTDPPSNAARVSTEGCNTILSWATAKQRIACVDTTLGLVTSHDLDPQSGIGTNVAVGGTASYVSSEWLSYRHLLSPSGKWLALATGTDLVLANLDLSPPTVVWAFSLGTSPAPLDMSFSPDEQSLVVNYNEFFQLFQPGVLGNRTSKSDFGTAPLTCQDQYPSALDWCGKLSVSKLPVWSPDSAELAYVRVDQKLVAIDTRVPGVDDFTIVSNCDKVCIDTGLFQP